MVINIYRCLFQTKKQKQYLFLFLRTNNKQKPNLKGGFQMSEDLVILYSGGADSRLMLELALRIGKKPYCVLVDYEQLHAEELDMAKRQLYQLQVSYNVVEIKNLNVESGLTGSGEKGMYKGVHEMHVPSRNLMFVSIAVSIAESKNINTVWYGADYSDFINKFPDCMPNWISELNDVLEINGPKPIKLEAPLIKMTKEDIVKSLKEYGVGEEEIFSGYGDL